MKSLLAKALGLLLLTQFVKAVAIEPLTCVDGSSWNDGCNQCRCFNGKSACTLRACLSDFKTQGSCVTGSRWSPDGCNWCDCVNGVGVCTRKLCQSQPIQRIRRSKSVDSEAPEKTCEFKDPTVHRWREECNWCSCSEKGLSLCSKRGCPPPIVERLEGTKECEGQARWKRDCNWCSCEDQKAVCTEKACPAKEEQQQQQESSITATSSSTVEPDCEVQDPSKDRWRSGCNWCSCGSKGIGFCTMMGCPQAMQEQLEQQPECEGSPRWKMDSCNWCSCISGKAVCSRKLCSDSAPVAGAPVARSLEPSCEGDPENAKWRQDCNWCRCISGKGACTKRGCPPPLRERLESSPECEGTVRWKKDCNWCTCVDGKGVCDKRGCPSDAPVAGAPVAGAPVAGAPIAGAPVAQEEGRAP